ncbi:MAG: type II toxin-antitoxin system RelE/ParE family toxin [Clostridiales bacterium]|jgi:mRNA interferase RelE/StbE|nr:type II toxin-antitoxin system RelE/ParE family toxin [Clostridiales bacterium]
MEVRLLKKAGKYLESLNEPIKSRIKRALNKLSIEPPQGDIKNIEGSNEYRLRIGDYRIIFEIRNDNIEISEIGLRGQIYKRR